MVDFFTGCAILKTERKTNHIPMKDALQRRSAMMVTALAACTALYLAAMVAMTVKGMNA